VLGVFGYAITANPSLKVIAISAPLSVVEAIEDALKRLDVPGVAPKNVELTAYLLIGSHEASSASVPPELLPVITQMKSTFPYKGFRLLDTLLVRGRMGQMIEASGIVTVDPGVPHQTPYAFRARCTQVTPGEKGSVIRLDALKLELKVPVGATFSNVTVSTDIDVREGQKVVVGKSSVGGADQALIVVLTARLVD
jgi:hypothetical protein